MQRFVDNKFKSEGPTIGVDFSNKSMNIDGQSVRLNIYDTAG